MLFKRISRTEAETVFIVVQNVSGSTLTAGYGCVFDTSASVDGVRVTQASAGDTSAFAGVAHSDIANSSYGLIQVYGYRASALISYSSVSVVVGDLLGPYAGQWGLARVAGTSASAKAFAFACEAVASSTAVAHTTTAKVFLRAL